MQERAPHPISSGRLRRALLLTFMILAVEVIGAVLSLLLALFSDARHDPDQAMSAFPIKC
jgi:Co/Zn/Cd efflux system component